MFAFGTSVFSSERYRKIALESIERLAEPDSVVLTRKGSSLQHAYNEILDEAAALDDLEGVILLHEDTEIVEPDLIPILRHRFADPAVAVIGALGARGVSSLAWWEGETFGRAVVPGLTAAEDSTHRGGVSTGVHQVETVDGFVMALSSWAVREVRFDPGFAADFHGYDVDYCLQVRARGRAVVVEDFDAVHHAPTMFRDPARRAAWIRANLTYHRKWGELAPGRDS